MTVDRYVIVTKPTRLEELVLKHMTESAAAFALESSGGSIASYQIEDQTYRRALSTLFRQLPSEVSQVSVSRSDLPSFLFREKDLVIVCGPDGLFVNLAQYLDNQLVLGVNPDPDSITGVLMPFEPGEVRKVLETVGTEKERVELLPFVKGSTDLKQVIWGINDLFVGRADQVSARYRIGHLGKQESQSSSGVIISTGVGSNAWMKSIVQMVEGLTGARPRTLASLPNMTDQELVFAVRESFPSPQTGTSLVTGRITKEAPLILMCEMPTGGVIFSDGIIERAIEWSVGSILTVSVGERNVRRLVRD